MPIAGKKPAPATKPKAQRSERSVNKKPSDVPAAAPIPEFDITVYYQEIAEVAYFNWVQRAGAPGSSEEDWLRAEVEVRARYTR